MRALLIGAPAMVAGVLLLKLTVADVPDREFCQVVSTSTDDRLQIETWAPADFNPLTRLHPFEHHCGGPGWLVLRDRRTGQRIGEEQAVQMWSIRDASVHWRPDTVGVELADDEITFPAPALNPSQPRQF